MPYRAALDWLNFFLADVRGGLGPYVSVFLLTEAQWNQAQIGVVLTISGLIGISLHIPIGAFIDATRCKRGLLVTGVGMLAAGAVAIERMPTWPVVLAADILMAVLGAVFAPTVAAITLGLVDFRSLPERFGRNAAFDTATWREALYEAGARRRRSWRRTGPMISRSNDRARPSPTRRSLRKVTVERSPPGASLASTGKENLAGVVERVTFHNEDSGFCVLRVNARGQRDLITIVGHAAAIGARRAAGGSTIGRTGATRWAPLPPAPEPLLRSDRHHDHEAHLRAPPPRHHRVDIAVSRPSSSRVNSGSRSGGDKTAVDWERMACHKTRAVRTQEQDGVGDFFGPRDTAHRMHGRELRPKRVLLTGETIEHGSVNSTRAHGVHANFLLRVFERDSLRQSDHGVLACRVDRNPREAD
jgi:hypothetical protein